MKLAVIRRQFSATVGAELDGGEGPMRAEIEQQIREFGLAECVRLTGHREVIPRRPHERSQRGSGKNL